MSNPEIANSISAAGIQTNYHDLGSGPAALFIHGSGPGVSAWANWRLVLPEISKRCRTIAPDMVGFGFSERPAGITYNMDTWVNQAVGLLDALGIEQTDLIGNSFGGALALALTIRHPQRVRRLVLMGSVGVPFEITPGLDAVWGYQPSFENMRRIMDYFAWDRGLVNDELAELRYRASIQPGFQESFSSNPTKTCFVQTDVNKFQWFIFDFYIPRNSSLLCNDGIAQKKVYANEFEKLHL